MVKIGSKTSLRLHVLATAVGEHINDVAARLLSECLQAVDHFTAFVLGKSASRSLDQFRPVASLCLLDSHFFWIVSDDLPTVKITTKTCV